MDCQLTLLQIAQRNCHIRSQYSSIVFAVTAKTRSQACQKSPKGLFNKLTGLPEGSPAFLGFKGLRVCGQSFFSMARYRKVTIWPLVQVSFGLNFVSEVPFVMPFSTAQAIALA